MKKNFYSMTKKGNAATINIYGDITSFPLSENDVSSDSLVKQLEEMGDVAEISVHINSYGGEVAEGLAIYNALKRHKAKVITYCDGFAASIASVIFMAGDERIMNDSSLLMIHNAWSVSEGNAEEFRKQADALDKITQASIIAYKAHCTISEEEIVALMNAESWILPEEALEYGFATAIEKTESKAASQNARKHLFELIKVYLQKSKDDEEKPKDAEPEDEQEDDASDNDAPDEEPDEEQPEDDEEEENTQEAAAQKWSGFFNALIKM